MTKLRLTSSLILIFFILGCKTITQKEDRDVWDFDKYMMESYKFTNNDKFQRAIDVLKEAIVKFPNEDILGLNYNIGFNYYKMKRYEDAIGYFNLVIKLYEEKIGATDLNGEFRKHVILSNSILNKIDADKEDAKDPYHIREDIEQNRKLRPKGKL